MAAEVVHEQECGEADQCHYLEDHPCKNRFENEIDSKDFPSENTHVPPVMLGFPNSFTIFKEFGT
jgi:hypothetical protein